MIGHYLLTLSKEQEDRVLTETFVPYPVFPPITNERCLVDAADGLGAGMTRVLDGQGTWFTRQPWQLRPDIWVGDRYDALCRRFKTSRTNAAIRNRILSNRARRTLQNRPVASRETVVEVSR